jgi:hypothetical protein
MKRILFAAIICSFAGFAAIPIRADSLLLSSTGPLLVLAAFLIVGSQWARPGRNQQADLIRRKGHRNQHARCRGQSAG